MIRELLIYVSAYIGLFAVTFYALSLFSIRKEKHPVFDRNNVKFVSIIIPAFNEENGIVGSIRSALEIK
jgi:cellulose synthase/poly-beta-1,6-N-acetylglucosamine synthase-like glycosyltransferase